MRITAPNKAKEIIIGRLGDNNSMRVIFDVSRWIQVLGEGGEWSALALQPNQTVAYIPTNITYESNKVYWDIQASELTEEGRGKFQLVYTQTDAQSVSAEYTTNIKASIFTNDPTVPTVYEAFYDKLVNLTTELNFKKVGYAEFSDSYLDLYSDSEKTVRIAHIYISAGETSGITETRCREIIESYGYATAEDLELKQDKLTAGSNIDITDNVISVITTDDAEEDNTKPITSSGAYVLIGNIDVLLSKI